VADFDRPLENHIHHVTLGSFLDDEVSGFELKWIFLVAEQIGKVHPEDLRIPQRLVDWN
jgi:hypothetical protein